MYILGISAFYHDSAACLLKDGDIVAAAQEERFTRKKQDFNFPKRAIQYCLDEAGIKESDLDYVAFYDKPFLKFERILETHLAFAPAGFHVFLQSVPTWLKQKLWMGDLVKNELNTRAPLIYPEHHESHAASCFYPSPFSRAAFLTIDGVGEWTTTSFGRGEGNSFEILKEIKFPHSLGLFYSAFTYYTGFKVNSGEYKMMGLAPYGNPKYVQLIYDNLIDVKEDGSIRLNMKFFNYCTGMTMTNKAFDELFGLPPRVAESMMTTESQPYLDIAASAQVVTEEIMLKMVRHIHKETQEKYLCLAGGVVLNCVANGRILREGPFEDIWIQPAAGDAGGALGAALFTWYRYLQNPRTTGEHDTQKGSYLGPAFSNERILEFLTTKKIPHHFVETADIPDKIAGLIEEGKVIGWFQGRMEFGPRALGSRSIIGDARNKEMQTLMNMKIKFRESFRPFAPSVMADRVSEAFQIDRESPYMLLVANVQESRCRKMSESEDKLWGIEKLKVSRSDIPAITHVDYSARIQTVNRRDNSLYYDMIKAFHARTGCPVIINTSFNVRGEPIVCRPEEAYICFMRTHIDYLILGNYLLDKREQPEMKDDIDWRKEFVLD
ncbi:MAG: carbamoyltransferase [Candidatus Eremiobacteraeota bacterium]|nr:carbamoyltransferase [Candidatus Eremiobacteraeota bacterium]